MTNKRPLENIPPVEFEYDEQDEFLQEALEETFPASDPISPGHPLHDKQPTKVR
ncbi:hypothetical protein [Ochrobactrum soli]|uniref:hypothetical protein n=1 Tax=Ochrobactrum soli TaxID=2448455 RepID=UPI0015E80863|nr:hypothetical protein [[Ochrobactrum] soli]